MENLSDAIQILRMSQDIHYIDFPFSRTICPENAISAGCLILSVSLKYIHLAGWKYHQICV